MGENNLQDAHNLVLVTGAGISTAAGLPTYRGAGGLYTTTKLPPVHVRNTRKEQLPELWEYFHTLTADALKARPTKAHEGIVRYALANPLTKVTVITQNIDGLHRVKAPNLELLELHGYIGEVRCTGFNHVTLYTETPRDLENVPRCQTCGGRCRPNVVLFGERLNQKDWKRAAKLTRQADKLVAVGTSASVVPVSDLFTIGRAQAKLWVNLEPPEEGQWTLALGTADEVLPGLLGV